MLASHHKGHLRKIYHDDYPCPVRFEAIEIYLQILLPAFTFNLIMQRTSSSIADVLPSLIIMMTRWSKIVVPEKYKKLCSNLIAAFKHKFKYELASPIYSVATLLNVSELSGWFDGTDCKEIRRSAVDNMVKVATEFLYKKNEILDSQEVISSQASSVDSMNCFLRDDDCRGNNESSNIPQNLTLP